MNNFHPSVPAKKHTRLIIGIIIVVIIIAIFIILAIIGKRDAENNYADITENLDKPLKLADIKINASDHVFGSENAKVTIIEFSDFECAHSAKFHTTMKKIISNYSKDVRWVYKHFPLDSMHPMAREAAQAAECAGEQARFWDFADMVFINQSNLSTSELNNIAQGLGLNIEKFGQCLSSGKYLNKINADYNQGALNGVEGTPGNFINGQLVPGAIPYENLEDMVRYFL